jgi:hypothetical protein
MPTTEERVAELERQIAELKREWPTASPTVAFERIDPSARLSMPPSAIRAMVDACPDSLMRAIVEEDRSRPSSFSLIEDDRPPPLNVAVERELKPPAGVAACDRMMDVADALDRRELERKLRR